MSRKFGVWIEGAPEGLIEPHWLPNDERTGDWTGTEEAAIERARYVGVVVPYESIETSTVKS